MAGCLRQVLSNIGDGSQEAKYFRCSFFQATYFALFGEKLEVLRKRGGRCFQLMHLGTIDHKAGKVSVSVFSSRVEVF